MTVTERVVMIVGGWLILAAFVNGADGHWLAVAVCLAWGIACLIWVFGRSRDRYDRRQARENAALLARFEEDARRAVESNHSDEWIKTREGFYVRARDLYRDRDSDRGGLGGSDQERDQR
ncbi:hypothetical protein KNU02_gp22 [Gordonia phage Pleakley]|uniref:Uncharacterized protein n=1 Tax=Gordonia phage Pleakley TaxID=2283246 RepID=A0A345M6E0_9CAUD|nr:hypothetical protein KNU02_gp22 [Gordonia phage Pleakley]AXH49748.1 hypothetical protein SEA_FURY_22 [Gordonia phage Fury]AXH66061.1 hypothetical protein SEA_PLEAKLEY_22 [Gordonia phage Pleakley]